MKTIWNSEDGLNKIVSDYSSNFSTYSTNVQNGINGIKALLQQMVDKANAEAAAKAAAAQAAAQKAQSSKPSSGGGSSGGGSSSSGSSSGNSNGNSAWGSWFIHKRDSYPKNRLDTQNSIVDRLKARDIDSSFSARAGYYSAMGGSGTYRGSSSQNRWMIQQMKAHGFKQGGTIGSLIKQTGEDGFVLARTGEEILSLEKIQALTKSFDSMNNLVKNMYNLNPINTNLSTAKNQNQNVNLTFDGDIIMNGVNNPEQFAEQLNHALRSDQTAYKIINQMTIGSLNGKNNLKYKTIK